MDNDAFEAQRKAALREMAVYVESDAWLDEQRRKSIAQLGSKWLLHSANRVQRRAVPYGSSR